MRRNRRIPPKPGLTHRGHGHFEVSSCCFWVQRIWTSVFQSELIT